MKSLLRLTAFVLLIGLETTAHAQLLERASRAARGSSQQSSTRDTGGSSRGSGSNSRQIESASDTPTSNTICVGDVIQCIRKSWHDAGLGDIGGIIMPWGTVLGAYPYAEGAGGYALPALDENNDVRDGRTAFRLEVDGGYVLEGAGRLGAAGRVQFFFFIDLATRYSFYWDPTDWLVIGRVDLEFRLIDAIGLQLRFGPGFRHFHDSQGGLYGVGGLFALDFFFIRPLVLSVETSIGVVIGDSSSTLIPSVRASAGFLVDATEFFVGYHYEAVVGFGDTVDLGGPMIGIRQWL